MRAAAAGRRRGRDRAPERDHAALPTADGVAWFTKLYLRVTTLDRRVGFAGRGLLVPLR